VETSLANLSNFAVEKNTENNLVGADNQVQFQKNKIK
jgi:hypothetical protein